LGSRVLPFSPEGRRWPADDGKAVAAGRLRGEAVQRALAEKLNPSP
jgi:hypothetical protein